MTLKTKIMCILQTRVRILRNKCSYIFLRYRVLKLFFLLPTPSSVFTQFLCVSMFR